MKVWIVRQYWGAVDGQMVWDFAGVFHYEEQAWAACLDETYFTEQWELTAWPEAQTKQRYVLDTEGNCRGNGGWQTTVDSWTGAPRVKL